MAIKYDIYNKGVNMLDNIIENKVKSFISSKCDNGRYTIMRRGLKELLISTGLVEVYIFWRLSK